MSSESRWARWMMNMQMKAADRRNLTSDLETHEVDLEAEQKVISNTADGDIRKRLNSHHPHATQQKVTSRNRTKVLIHTAQTDI